MKFFRTSPAASAGAFLVRWDGMGVGDPSLGVFPVTNTQSKTARAALRIFAEHGGTCYRRNNWSLLEKHS